MDVDALDAVRPRGEELLDLQTKRLRGSTCTQIKMGWGNINMEARANAKQEAATHTHTIPFRFPVVTGVFSLGNRLARSDQIETHTQTHTQNT